MKRLAVMLIAAAMLGTVLPCAGAESFDAASYSYEELQLIQQKITDRLTELDRLYAMEHADRSITFPEEEQVVFVKYKLDVMPQVDRLTEDAPAKTKIKWSSSNPDVATVSTTGKVTGISRGDAVITATAADSEYISDSYTVHVILPVTRITVWGQEDPLLLGKDEETAVSALKYSIEPEDAYYQEVEWSSSDETVVTVDENGQIRGLKAGKAIIRAKSTEPARPGIQTVSASYTVSVQQLVTELELSETELAMNDGNKKALGVTVTPGNAGNKAVLFSSSDPEVAAVDAKGNVTALGRGECEIRCEAADGGGAAAVCHVTVTRLVSGVKAVPEEIRMNVGEAVTAETEITPEDAEKKELKWESSDEQVARVSEGRIEGIGTGECEVTCTTTDGSNISAAVKVTIPTIGTAETEYTVTEKEGITIPVTVNTKSSGIRMEADTDCFTAELTESGMIRIMPEYAGKGSLRLSIEEKPEEATTLLISVENSAVYNQESYPPFDYERMASDPENYAGAPVSATGRVLMQIGQTEDGVATFMIGTSGEAYTDKVILVQCGTELLPAEMKQGDILTIYGYFNVEKTYGDALATEAQIPGITAEKIVRKKTDGQ